MTSPLSANTGSDDGGRAACAAVEARQVDIGKSVQTASGAVGFTPGPWTCERQDQDGGDIYWAVHATQNYEFITNVYESAGNARLIAAAPDLLAALREVDSWRMQSLDMMPPEIRGAWLRAHAAIAKASGVPT